MVDFQCFLYQSLGGGSLFLSPPYIISQQTLPRLSPRILPGSISLLPHQRNPNPYITTHELSKLMQWKLSLGNWRPRLLDFVSSLDEELVKSASQKAFESLPDISKAVSEFTILKGVGPATASAVLAAYAPHVAPFMSDEAMEAALGSSKDYTWKRYLSFVDELQEKTKELSSNVDLFTTSGVERALWGSSVCAKLLASQSDPDPKSRTSRDTKERENVEVMVLGD